MVKCIKEVYVRRRKMDLMTTYSWFSGFQESFEKTFIREDRYKLFIDGILLTLKVSLLAVCIGIIIGFLIALCNLSKHLPLRLIGKVYTDVIRGTPSVTQLMIIYFVIFASVDLEKWIIASIAFGINSGAYVSEIIRAGIMSIDKGQTEAGRALGLSWSKTMRKIILPQAVKNVIPAIGNEMIALLKETSIISWIGATVGTITFDLNAAASTVNRTVVNYLASGIVAGAMYLAVVYLMILAVKLIERRLGKNERR